MILRPAGFWSLSPSEIILVCTFDLVAASKIPIYFHFPKLISENSVHYIFYYGASGLVIKNSKNVIKKDSLQKLS